MNEKTESEKKTSYIYSQLKKINYSRLINLRESIELQIVNDKELKYKIKTRLKYIPSIETRIKDCIIDAAIKQGIYKVYEIKELE